MCWEAVPEANDPNRKVVFGQIVLGTICAQFQWVARGGAINVAM